MTKERISRLSHTFNYFIPIFDKDGKEIVYRIWTLDSGVADGICPG